jgi:hypothetical protein
MFTWNNILQWTVSGLVQNFVWVIVAIIFVQVVQRAVDQWKYGKWRVVVYLRGVEKVNREISAGKVKEILAEPAELSVFIKGVASPYGWINCDVLTEGRKIGLLTEEKDNRRMVINLDKNPLDISKIKDKSPVKKRRA